MSVDVGNVGAWGSRVTSLPAACAAGGQTGQGDQRPASAGQGRAVLPRAGDAAPTIAAKQALLEADTLSERCELLIQLMQFFGRSDPDEARVTLQ